MDLNVIVIIWLTVFKYLHTDEEEVSSDVLNAYAILKWMPQYWASKRSVRKNTFVAVMRSDKNIRFFDNKSIGEPYLE